MSKKIKRKIRTYVFTCCVCTKSFHEKLTCCLAYVKGQILVLKTKYFMVHVLSFLHRPRAMSFFHETLRTQMDYGDVHVKKIRLNFMTQ
jgi:hypothetical protein